MSASMKSNVIKTAWGKACRSCGSGGGGGEGMGWLRLLWFIAAIFGMSAIILASNWLSARGVRILEARCAWEEASGTYVAGVTAQNPDDLFKLVELSIQGRFRPPPGERWPHHAIRARHESQTHQVVLFLEPERTAEQQTAFMIPGTHGFLCDAHVRIGRQERFAERPSDEVLEAVSQELVQRTPVMRGLRGRGAR